MEEQDIYEAMNRQYQKAAEHHDEPMMARIKSVYADMRKAESDKMLAEAAKRATSKTPPPPFGGGAVVPRYQTAPWNLEPMHLGRQLHLPSLTMSSQLTRRMAERVGFFRRNNPQGIYHGR